MNVSTASDDNSNPELSGFHAPLGLQLTLWGVVVSVGQAFLTVLNCVLLQEQLGNFPFLIFHNFSFLIYHLVRLIPRLPFGLLIRCHPPRRFTELASESLVTHFKEAE